MRHPFFNSRRVNISTRKSSTQKNEVIIHTMKPSSPIVSSLLFAFVAANKRNAPPIAASSLRCGLTAFAPLSGLRDGPMTIPSRPSRKWPEESASFHLAGQDASSRHTFSMNHRRLSSPDRRLLRLHSSNNKDGGENSESTNDSHSHNHSRRGKLRSRLKQLAKSFGTQKQPSPVATRRRQRPSPLSMDVGDVLEDSSTFGDVNLANSRGAARRDLLEREAQLATKNRAMATALDADAHVEEAFRKADEALVQAERALDLAHRALGEAKLQARSAIDSAEAAAVGEARRAEAVAEEANRVVRNIVYEADHVDVSTLTYDDVGYHLNEDMGEPFLNEDMCLVPGEAIARVEKAPENSRRIFAGIDILASVDDIWNLLTDYEHLQDVVPNLVVNEVVEVYDGKPAGDITIPDPNLPDETQCQSLASQMRGSKLKQVGGAKVVGINFSASTTLEVREWPQGMPDFAHFGDDMYQGKTRDDRARENAKMKLRRYRFPRPFALSRLPTRDISMQSVEDDDGEFRMYQGVWRMQPLVGCAPEGEHAMRLTYAVEVSPRPYLPVALVERRIVSDLCSNLASIRDHMAAKKLSAAETVGASE